MSNLVLYRKYRPQKFAEVINQEHVKTTLMNAVSSGRVGHAYLFTGPRGVGMSGRLDRPPVVARGDRDRVDAVVLLPV